MKQKIVLEVKDCDECPLQYDGDYCHFPQGYDLDIEYCGRLNIPDNCPLRESEITIKLSE